MAPEPDAFTRALADFPVHLPPPSLYRFSGALGGVSALRDLTIKLTRPEDFNDPFEILPGIAAADLNADAVVRSLMAPNGLPRKASGNRQRGSADEAKLLAHVTAGVLSAPEHIPEYARKSINAIGDTFREALGVCCFAAFEEDDLCGELGIRHWSHYSDHHRGVAIEYDGKHGMMLGLSMQKVLFPVEYCPARVQAKLEEFEDWTDTKMWQLMRRWTAMKSHLAWGDEKEWRFMAPLDPFLEKGVAIKTRVGDQEISLFQLLHGIHDADGKMNMARIIRRVIFGVRTAQATKDEVLELLSEPHLRHVQVAQATLSPSDFRLEIKRIT